MSVPKDGVDGPADNEVIPARHGRAVRLKRGQFVELTNTFGQQVVDTWAFGAVDPTERLSMEDTRSKNSSVYARAGDVLYSDRRRPMLAFVSDSSPGRHDMLLCACNQAIYVELGCEQYHRNCRDNLREALASVGIDRREAPSPLNLFMNVQVGPEGQVQRFPPASKPGDRVVLRAEIDLVVVFSSCPQDITPINGALCTPTDVHYRIIDAGPIPVVAQGEPL